MKLTYIVPKSTTYTNVKEVLKAEFCMSDRLVLKLKKMQNILLNNHPVYVHHSISPQDVITCLLDYKEDNSNMIPNQAPLCIVYEDDAYLVVNKPFGVPIHPSFDHYTDSLSNMVRFYFDKIGLFKKIRPVNRLDKDTTGLVIFAKNEYIQECFIKQMKSKDFVKKYIAIIDGHIEPKQGSIIAPIARKENSIIERCVCDKGDMAITHYKVLCSNDIVLDDIPISYDIIECTLETGRTHQIRVHFSHIGHALLGDTLYGKGSYLMARQALHSYYISFIHPITKQKVTYTSHLPEDMKKWYKVANL